MLYILYYYTIIKLENTVNTVPIDNGINSEVLYTKRLVLGKHLKKNKKQDLNNYNKCIGINIIIPKTSEYIRD